MDSVPAWAARPAPAVPEAAFQGLLPDPAELWARARAASPPCPVSPVDAQLVLGEREGKGGQTQTPGFCTLKGAQLG